MPEFLTNMFVAVTVGIVTALATAHFALRKFRSEKWWERRADAYASIIEALHHVKRGFESDLRDMEMRRPPRESPHAKALEQKTRDASDELLKAVDMSSFLLADEAAEALAELMRGYRKAEEDGTFEHGQYDVYTIISGHSKAVHECLKKFPSIAKRDLAVK